MIPRGAKTQSIEWNWTETDRRLECIVIRKVIFNILAPDVSNSKNKSGNGLSEIDILQQS